MKGPVSVSTDYDESMWPNNEDAAKWCESGNGLLDALMRGVCNKTPGQPGCAKKDNFAIPSGARNLSVLLAREKKERFLAPLGMTKVWGSNTRVA